MKKVLKFEVYFPSNGYNYESREHWQKEVEIMCHALDELKAQIKDTETYVSGGAFGDTESYRGVYSIKGQA